MVFKQPQHTYIVRYTPPEGDLLTNTEREALDHEEGKLALLIMEAAAAKMIQRFRRRFAKVVAGMALAAASPQFEARIVDGAVEVRVQYPQLLGDTDATDLFTDAVVRTWERVANPTQAD